MKKVLTLLAVATIALSLSACGDEEPATSTEATNTNTQETTNNTNSTPDWIK